MRQMDSLLERAIGQGARIFRAWPECVGKVPYTQGGGGGGEGRRRESRTKK